MNADDDDFASEQSIAYTLIWCFFYEDGKLVLQYERDSLFLPSWHYSYERSDNEPPSEA